MTPAPESQIESLQREIAAKEEARQEWAETAAKAIARVAKLETELRETLHGRARHGLDPAHRAGLPDRL